MIMIWNFGNKAYFRPFIKFKTFNKTVYFYVKYQQDVMDKSDRKKNINI
jgi:hypothetical protein